MDALFFGLVLGMRRSSTKALHWIKELKALRVLHLTGGALCDISGIEFSKTLSKFISSTIVSRIFSLLDTLAAAYAEDGQFEKAIATATRAVEIANSAGQSGFAQRIDGRLQRYKTGKPFRDK